MPNEFSGNNLIYILVTVIISLTLHEAMHAFVGFKLGDDTAKEFGRVSLNPLKHIDPIYTILLPIITLKFFGVPVLAAKPVPFNPGRVRFNEFGGALIAIAGPLTNLLLAILAALVLHNFQLGQSLGNFLVIFAQWNVAIFVFNIIPIPPLDGSRVLYAFAPESLQRFMEKIEPYGFFLVIGLAMSGLLSPIIIKLNNDILSLLA